MNKIDKNKGRGSIAAVFVVIFTVFWFVGGCRFLESNRLSGNNVAETSFDYFQNSWYVTGLKDYRRGTRITPDNQLLIGEAINESRGGTPRYQPSVRIRYGQELSPLSKVHTKRLLEGWLPIVMLSAKDDEVHYEFKIWATPLPAVDDWAKAFDWPVYGDNFLNWIHVEITNGGTTQAPAKLKVEQVGEFGDKRHPVPCLDFAKEFSWLLEPGENVEATIRIPWAEVEEQDTIEAADAKVWLERTVRFWRKLLLQCTRIEVPCKKATNALRASHICQLIANDHGEIHAGEGFYDCFWIRDAAYQVLQYEEAGLLKEAFKGMQSFLSHQRGDGRFESQKGQWDANGQALWALWHYYKITGDKSWLERVYPRMCRAVKWTMEARHRAAADSPFARLLPQAPADGEFLWAGHNHIVGYDFWNLRGVLCTAEAAKELGKSGEAERYFSEAESYREDIERAWRRAGVDYFPPSWELDGTHWGNTEVLWPTRLFQEDDTRVAALIDEVRHHYLGGYVEGTIQWTGNVRNVIHPYMGSYTTMSSLVRGEDEQVVEDFYWYLLHSTATHAFAEGILYNQRKAWHHTIPHATGASNYAFMLRHMLVHEEGDKLHLLKAVPDWWLGKGQQIKVIGAPTHFGFLSCSLAGKKDGVLFNLLSPERDPPDKIILHMPRSRKIINPPRGVKVVYRAEQTKRWDFPAVVELYQRQNNEAAKMCLRMAD